MLASMPWKKPRTINFFVFLHDTPTTEIYTLPYTTLFRSLRTISIDDPMAIAPSANGSLLAVVAPRSEEHTSELQSQSNLVCRLLLEKKKAPVAPAVRKSSDSLNRNPDPN